MKHLEEFICIDALIRMAECAQKISSVDASYASMQPIKTDSLLLAKLCIEDARAISRIIVAPSFGVKQ